MKYTIILTLFCVVISFTSSAQEDMIIGETSIPELMNNDNFEWFNSNYKAFKSQPEHIKQISELFAENNYTLEVYFGTWCSDSQREVPNLIKILDESKFDFKRLKLIGVPESKEVPNISEEKRKLLNITNVPTIIVYENGKEVNRYVEYAVDTLEQDLIKILSKEPYKHSYY
jgi:thiol-disulfide isomerase/thioredoxin